MMGHYEVAYYRWQILALCYLSPLHHMVDDDTRTLTIRHVVVWVHACLVLGEEHGVYHLAYVVIQSASTHKQRVGSYLVGYLGSKISHSDGVLECAWSHLREIAQNASVGV